MRPRRVCSATACDNLAYGRGLCQKHYLRHFRRGTLPAEWGPTLEQRLWERIDTSAGAEMCWPWTGTLTEWGYGIFYPARGVRVRPHRKIYELASGEELGTLQVDHICHNKACCNPRHLRSATNKQNNEHLAGAQRNSRTGVRNVFWDKASGRYAVQIKHNRRTVHVGLFDSIEEAAEAALAKRLELFTHSDPAHRTLA